MASGAPNRRHAPLIVTPECGCANGHINDRLIDQQPFTPDRTAIEIFLWKRAKRFLQGFRPDRLVALATHTSLSLSLPAHHRSRHISGAISSISPSLLYSADRSRDLDPYSAGSAGGRSRVRWS